MRVAGADGLPRQRGQEVVVNTASSTSGSNTGNFPGGGLGGLNGGGGNFGGGGTRGGGGTGTGGR